jgi:hypothetical protein
MTIHYKLTFEDYLAAQKIHTRSSLWRRFALLIWLWILPGIGFLFLLLLLSLKFSNNPPADNSGIFTFAWLSSLFIVFRLLRAYSFRKQYAQIFPAGFADSECYFLIDDQQIVSEIPGATIGRYTWPVILDYRREDKISIIYVRKNFFLIVSLSSLSADEISEFDSFFTRNKR